MLLDPPAEQASSRPVTPSRPVTTPRRASADAGGSMGNLHHPVGLSLSGFGSMFRSARLDHHQEDETRLQFSSEIPREIRFLHDQLHVATRPYDSKHPEFQPSVILPTFEPGDGHLLTTRTDCTSFFT
jgi:hypothetical protein